MIMLANPDVPAPTVVRPANREAIALTGRAYISFSQLSLMRACPRKFAFQYVEHVEPDFAPSSLVFGGAIHSALEAFFRAQLEGATLGPSELLVQFRQAWAYQTVKEGKPLVVRFGKTEDEGSLVNLAERIFAAFLNSPVASPKGAIIGVEEQLTVTLADDLPDLLAKVDLVTQTDDGLHVVDFKTSRSRWTEAKAQEGSDQLVLYALSTAPLAAQLSLPVRLHFAVFTKAKHPVVQVLPVSVGQDRTATLTASVHQVWAAAKAGHFYPNPSPQHCTTCPFKSRCPAFIAT